VDKENNETTKKNKTKLLFVVSVVVLLIATLGGFFLSQNPQIISKIKYQIDDRRHQKLLEVKIVADASCASAAAGIFSNVCARYPEDIFEDADFPSWKENLSDAATQCLFLSYKNITLYKLEYDGLPESDFDLLYEIEGRENVELLGHACDIASYANYTNPEFISKHRGFVANNAEDVLNKYYDILSLNGTSYYFH